MDYLLQIILQPGCRCNASIVERTSRNGSKGMTENTCKFRLLDHITLHLTMLPFPDPLLSQQSYSAILSVASPSLLLGYLAALPSHIHCLRPTASTSLLFVFHLSTPRSCGLFGNSYTSIHIFWVRYVEDSKCAHAWVF